jgi:uncharacterized protein (TIGR02391 family)
MRRLDDRTLEHVAELVCGGGQGYENVPGRYRTAGQIWSFFSAAGVDPPAFSGTRKWWTLDVLRELNGGAEGRALPNGIESVLLRLVDLREYVDCREKLPAVKDRLNSILVADGVQIDWHPHAREFMVSELEADQWAAAMEQLAGPQALAEIQSTQSESASSLLDHLQLHPLVKEVSGPLYRDGHYAQAILEAFKALNSHVKTKARRPDLDGRDLMAKAFRKESPILRLTPLATQSDMDEQDGFMLIFMGAMAGIRNPKAHDNVSQPDQHRALEYLALASLLCRRVDESTLEQARNS